MSRIRFSDDPSIVDPFLSTVRLLVPQAAPSAITTVSPSEGVAGKVKVHAPPDVSAIIPSSAEAV
jgi:hypothetical protein